MEKRTKKGGMKKALAVGAGIAAISAAAYVLLGPNGKKNRKAVHAEAAKIKREVMKKLKTAKEVSRPVYDRIVAEVGAKYATLKSVKREDVEQVVSELRKQWKHIAARGKKVARTPAHKPRTTSSRS